MKNNNRDYTELQLHYLELDEYICENIYPINNIVFTEKINWLTGLAAVGGAVALGFLVKFIWKSIANNNRNREQIKKVKKATKKQQEENDKTKSNANLSSEQEQKLDEINNASVAEIKENIVPAFEQSEEKPPVTSKDSEKEISNNPNNAQQSNKNQIASENNINKIISDIGSLEKKIEVIEEKQVQIFSQDQHKDLKDKQIDQDKIKTKSLPVETIKNDYDEEFDNFIDLYNENMAITNFGFKYISYHYDELKNISINYNKNKKYSIDISPLKHIIQINEFNLDNLYRLIFLFIKTNETFKLSRVKSMINKDELLTPIDHFNIDLNSETILIWRKVSFFEYDKLNEYPWLNIYTDLSKDENYDEDYCIFKKGTYEKIIQKHEDEYKDVKLINDIDDADGNLESEKIAFNNLKELIDKVTKSEINLVNLETLNTFIKLRKEQLKAYLLEQATQQNN